MRRLTSSTLVLLLAACAPPAFKDQSTRIGDFTRNKQAAGGIAPVTPSEQVAANQEAALDNYRRIAEMATDPAVRAEAMRRAADLEIQFQEQQLMSSDSEESQRRAIALYQKLLDERPPNDPDTARVLYQLARAQQNVGDSEQAAATLALLSERFPQSEFSEDARFRRGEQLYRIDDFEGAAVEYRHVVETQAATPFFEPAQYKLAWSLYKMGDYNQALNIAFTILDRELPQGELTDPKSALDGTARGKREMAQDALRISGLALANLGGGETLNQIMAARKDPRYFVMLYRSLGEDLLDKKRYSDAAKVYLAFGRRYARHPLAPAFQSRAIAAYQDGGFAEPVLAEKERYVTLYDPQAAYWAGRATPPDIRAELRQHLGDLAQFHQARAQTLRETDSKAAQRDFIVAASWYERLLEVFPNDAKASELGGLLADALLESGNTEGAAEQYEKAAFSGLSNPDAGYAAVLAYRKLASEVPADEQVSAQKKAVAISLKFADTYKTHQQTLAVLTRSAEDQYQLKSYDAAIEAAARVVRANAPAELRRTAWSVVADAQFTRARYPEAEAAYTEVLKLSGNDKREAITEQLAAAIYKQGEALKSKNPRQAALLFLRVGDVAPAATIRATADYDAAALLIAVQDWAGAARVLESFRSRYPSDPLLPDVDKKLAAVYQKTGKADLAAAALRRIAGRGTETADTRREAAWLAAKYYDDTRNPQAAEAYTAYIKNYGAPLERVIEARSYLAERERTQGSDDSYVRQLREIVSADTTGGSSRTARTKFLAAKAQLVLGQREAAQVQKLALKLPLDKSIQKKKAAMESAIGTLTKASAYGYVEVSTAATHELGALYRNFAQTLLKSDRPKRLSSLELEQYNILLEEQAFPFEEKAIEWYETNLKLAGKGIYDEWVGKSARDLGQMVPGRFGKRERREDIYDELR